MMVTVTENTSASVEETVGSPDFSIQECVTDNNEHGSKQQTSFCDPKEANSNVKRISQSYTDIEDSSEKTVKGNHRIDSIEECEESDESSYVNLLLTVYIPLVLLWFRRSMFGPANLIRSIVVGQLMRFVFVDDISERISEKLHRWLEIAFFQSSAANGNIKGTNVGNVSAMLGAGSGKIDPHAWPPPAFTALALLTIFALVVHPDGLTWIMLGRLRDTACAGISILGQCLEYLLNDYGVIPTIIAAITLATILFIVFIIIRTLSPKKPRNDLNKRNNTLHNERKKKKKKGGNARHRRDHHRSNRTKLSSSSPSHIEEETEDSSTAASPRSPMLAQSPSKIEDDTPLLPSSSKDEMDNPISMASLSIPSQALTDNFENIEDGKEITNDRVRTTSGMNKSKEKRTRLRMMSGSTLDTTPLSDDQSCGSISVRSFPSISVTSSRSSVGSMSQKNTKASVLTPRRVKRQGIAKSPKNAEKNSGKKKKGAVMDTLTPSRWDALKPEHDNASKGNNHAYDHHHANGNTTHKKQHQHQRHPRGGSRRNKGNHGNGQKRKGRQNQKSVTDQKPMIDKNSVTTTPVPSSGSSLRLNNVRININEEPSIVPSNQHKNSSPWSTKANGNPILNTYNISPQSNSKPNPPPGFKKASAVHEDEKKSSSRYSYQHQVNNHLPIHTLFETPLTIRPVSDAQPQDFSRTTNTTIASQRSAAVITPAFFHPSSPVSSSIGFSIGGASTGRMIQENPFISNTRDISAPSKSYDNGASYQANLDSQIEAELQELGGQMAGSILDF